MREKGGTKGTKTPNFWGRYKDVVPEETKKFVYDQYLDSNTLCVYCDSSISKEIMQMSLACSYVTNGTVLVKNSIIYAERDLTSYPVYGELKAILFALNNVEKHIIYSNNQIIIFSDISTIEDFLKNVSNFKNTKIEQVRKDIILEYNRLCTRHKDLNIKIEYLPTQFHVHNPFYISAHNTARKMLKNK